MPSNLEQHTSQCPLAGVDRRLEDVHQHWHQAEQAYFYPDRFRVAIQTAIQTLRTVTFILQNKKHDIPEFDAWYGDWREKLRTDSLMRRMVGARNKIEKQGDLEVHSFVRAEIVASYLDEGPSVELPAHLFDAPLVLIRSIPPGDLRKHIARNGTLRIERRWVENTLPDYELLDAVAIAYGRIARLVHDAHRQMGLEAPATTCVETGQRYGEGAREGRLPCMIGHSEARSLYVNLADGMPFEFERVGVKIDKADAKRVTERYGKAHARMFGPKNANEEEIATNVFRTARKVFLKDGYHKSIFFLFKKRRLVCLLEIRPENQAQKYLLFRTLAHEVTKFGADSVIMLGEMWTAPADPLKPYQQAVDSPAREEALVASLVTKDGSPIEFTAKIRRNAQRLALGKTRIHRDMAAFSFAPVYKAWGRPIPESWIESVRQLHEASKSAEP